MRIGFPKKVPMPIDQSCVLYYKMDEAFGNIKDWSGKGFTGNAGGNPIYSVPGIFGNAIEFNGIDSIFGITTAARLPAASLITLSAWVYPHTITGNRFLARFYGSGSSARSGSIGLDNGGFNFYIQESGTTAATAYTGNIVLNKWYHVVGTWDHTNVKIYLNGELKQSPTLVGTASASGASGPAIGNSVDSGNVFFNGIIDDIRVYNRALSPSEIKRQYMRGR